MVQSTTAPVKIAELSNAWPRLIALLIWVKFDSVRFDGPFTSFLTALATNGWLSFPFMMVVSLGALQSIPADLYEAARVDGASRWQSYRTVTIPAVRPATTLVVLLAIITGANLFTEPYLMTSGGGPNGATTTPVFLLYQKGIEQGTPDVASAIGVLLVIGVLIIAYASRKVTERE